MDNLQRLAETAAASALPRESEADRQRRIEAFLNGEVLITENGELDLSGVFYYKEDTGIAFSL